jgi:hypothetical protein
MLHRLEIVSDSTLWFRVESGRVRLMAVALARVTRKAAPYSFSAIAYITIVLSMSYNLLLDMVENRVLGGDSERIICSNPLIQGVEVMLRGECVFHRCRTLHSSKPS